MWSRVYRWAMRRVGLDVSCGSVWARVGVRVGRGRGGDIEVKDSRDAGRAKGRWKGKLETDRLDDA